MGAARTSTNTWPSPRAGVGRLTGDGGIAVLLDQGGAHERAPYLWAGRDRVGRWSSPRFLRARPQPRARARAGHGGRRARRRPLDRPGREGVGRPGGGRRHALRARHRGHGRHGRDRRGREGRGAHALQRRAHRGWVAARRRHRRRPARGHHAHRQGLPERPVGDRTLRAGHHVRPGPLRLHGQDGRRGGGGRCAGPRPADRRDARDGREGQGHFDPGRDGGHARPSAPRGARPRGPRGRGPDTASSPTATCRPRSWP